MSNPPTPSAIRLIQGYPDKRAKNEFEPKPNIPERVPSPPPYLSEIAGKEWQRIAKPLHDLGLLTELDITALAAYCEAFEDWVTAKTNLDKWNKLHLDSKNIIFSAKSKVSKPHPYLTMRENARRDLVRLAAEFGMTPSTRTRISVSRKDHATNPFAGF